MTGKVKYKINPLRCMGYASGESEKKKHKELITHVCDRNLVPGLDARGVCSAIEAVCLSHPKVSKPMFQIILSPTKEESKNFTLKDWVDLWDEFVAEMDSQEYNDKNGKIKSRKTNFAGSKASVYLHRDSNSGIPHMHGIVSHVADDGTTNDVHMLHVRIMDAVDKVARRRGWKLASKIRDENKQKLASDCMQVLKGMKTWSWGEYFSRLTSMGYDVKARTDTSDKVVGYTVRKGRASFKASELASRKLMASTIVGTWQKLHPQPVVRHVPNTLAGPTEKRKAGSWRERAMRQQSELFGPAVPKQAPDKLESERTGMRECSFRYEGHRYTCCVPDFVLEMFDDEFSGYANSDEFIDYALAMFTIIGGYGEVHSSGGGGGSSSDSKWGRDPEEEERKWAYKCMMMANQKITPKGRGMHR